ncbi:MAG: hypothetical protein R2911_40270 [Caldilineaceae bacterium]
MVELRKDQEGASQPNTITLQELLLAAPTLTDEEFAEFTRVREWMEEWRADEFLHPDRSCRKTGYESRC